ncbi:neprilysin-4-like [Cimex lectularius]|uniref:Endothelin-converting enzyme n=1 Tax=Cimex lectularius TaxID=79782 RepID=A0A8I6R6G2_CIMLE|nr:neprilysin-4-like [Cimex lectularius]
MKNIVVVFVLGNIALLWNVCHTQANLTENYEHQLKEQTSNQLWNKNSSEQSQVINKECTDCNRKNIFINELNIFSPKKIENLGSWISDLTESLVKKAEEIIETTNQTISYDPKDELAGKDKQNILHKPEVKQDMEKEEKYKLNFRHHRAQMMQKYMDTTVDPCQDFYTFACGNWPMVKPIPWNTYHYNIFDFAKGTIVDQMKKLLEQPISDNEPKSFTKAKNYYKSCVNRETIESRGSKPLLTLLDSLGGWPLISNNWNGTNFDWISLAGKLSRYTNEALIAFSVSSVNESQLEINIDKPRIAFPTRYNHIWNNNSNDMQTYMNFIKEIATLLGANKDKITEAVKDVINFEMNISRIILPKDGLLDKTKSLSLDEINQSFPKLDLKRYISTVFNLTDDSNEQVVIHSVYYFTELGKILEDTEASTIANYLLWNVVERWVVHLDQKFKNVYKQFHSQLPVNVSKMNCFKEVRNGMKSVVDEMFLNTHFNEFIQNDTTIIRKSIQESFKEAVSNVKWLNQPAKNTVKEKIDALKFRIKFLDNRRTTEELDNLFMHVTIDPATYFENFIAITMYDVQITKSQIALSKKEIQSNGDITEVGTSFIPNENEIVATVGIFQPPFYHKYFPQCLNYGGFGGVISHEMLLGFDYYEVMHYNGNLATRLTEESYMKVYERATCVTEQYLSERDYEKYEGYQVEAKNIADSEGIKHAYAAYKKWLNVYGDSDEKLPGMNYTSGQLLFLNFAQMWCENINLDNIDEGTDRMLIVPGKFRVIGTLRNNQDFSKEFNCPLGSPMNPRKKCTVW